MDLTFAAAEEAVAALVGEATSVVPVGSGTHREVGGPVPEGTEVRAPAGIVTYDPEELTVTVGAGTTVAALDAALAEAGQECVLSPRDTRATVGGTLACGLSGPRRLRYGPLRDRVLEVRYASARGALVRGGGPTVKNVTGYDMPRLLVGSLGTLGVLTRVILRCQPRAAVAWWGTTDGPPEAVLSSCFRPSSVLWDGSRTAVLLEGHPGDVEREARAAGLAHLESAPTFPTGLHRGRISVTPARVTTVGRALDAEGGIRWLAEVGVGTIHVATDEPMDFVAGHTVARKHEGWLLREEGAPFFDGFGGALPNAELMARVKHELDPTGKLAPGRLPFPAAREAAPR